MRVKKAFGKILGADLSSAEKKAMQIEIHRQIAEYDRNNLNEIDAVILWTLHEEYGWGRIRLKRFYKSVNTAIRKLLDRYEMDDSDSVWLCTYKLKEYGIDLDEWEKEIQ